MQEVCEPDGRVVDLIEGIQHNVLTTILDLDTATVDKAIETLDKVKKKNAPVHLQSEDDIWPDIMETINKSRAFRAKRGPHPDQPFTRIRL